MSSSYTAERSSFLLSGFFIVIMLVLIAITMSQLYSKAVEERRDHLVATVQSQARLIEALARFDNQYGRDKIPGGAEEATLLQIREAHKSYVGSGKSGEISLAKLENDRIHFLLRHRKTSTDSNAGLRTDIKMGSEDAIPMQLALSGKSGSVIARDYLGAIVLAAYEPVRTLDYGIVAKIDMAEIRAPFWRAGLSSIAVGSVFIFVGVFAFLRITRPLTRAIQDTMARYKGLFDGSDIAVKDEDFSEVVKTLEELRRDGVSDLREYLNNNPHVARELAGLVRINRVNEATLRLYGADSDEQLLAPIEKVFGPEAMRVFVNLLCAIWNGDRMFRADTTQQALDGRILNVIISMPIPAAGDSFRSIPVSFLDITERKRIEEELQKISRAVEASSTMVVITDRSGIIEYVNPKFTEVTGYSREEVLGGPAAVLYSQEHSNEFYDEILETVLSGREWKGDIRHRKKDGSLYWDRTNISGVANAEGEIRHFVAIQDDVSEEYELKEQLSYQASYDPLTGLLNRREFEKRTQRLLRTVRNSSSQHALCFLDLDQFKIINDTCGHTAGDELLNQLAKLLQEIVRKRDTLARLGGDEFGLLMEHCPMNQAQRVAEDILQAIADYQFVWEGTAFRIGVSIGLVAVTEATGNYTELFKQADSACYLAKDLGRNRIHTYHPDDTELAVRHGQMQWVGRIYNALDNNRFCLYAQPIVSLDGEYRKHYELLLRMLGEQGEIIPPGAFLPAAERYDLNEKLDNWVVANACKVLAQNPALLESVDMMSINLSGPSLNNRNFINSIIRGFGESGICAEKICFEITETVAISNLGAAANFISTLKNEGFRFSLDDFGSGISSFGYLKNLPVDFLKIDGMFVKDIVDDPIDRAMVKSINEIGQVMGMQTIAEFVENSDIESMLKVIGVDYAEGYGIGRPLPLEDLLEPGNESRLVV